MINSVRKYVAIAFATLAFLIKIYGLYFLIYVGIVGFSKVAIYKYTGHYNTFIEVLVSSSFYHYGFTMGVLIISFGFLFSYLSKKIAPNDFNPFEKFNQKNIGNKIQNASIIIVATIVPVFIYYFVHFLNKTDFEFDNKKLTPVDVLTYEQTTEFIIYIAFAVYVIGTMIRVFGKSRKAD
ncbi:MAG: hypothetical protein HRU28_03285 [Rhizobiales bacterium]|nr:hypothetical protein [Hyphomicrobiales bacterium]